jgi:NitT/TauT family transport system substrate-binding protein
MASISRRDAIAAIGGTLAAWPLRHAIVADLPVVRVGIFPIFVVAPHLAADRLGYFTAEGISVASQMVQGGTIGVPALVSGAFDILYSNTTAVLTAFERGIDLRIIAEGTRIPKQPPDPATLVQRKGSGMHSGKDVEGKTIAVNAKFDIQWLISQEWIKQTGGDPSKVSYREVPLPAMADALKSGQVDAAVMVDPFLAIALSDPNFEVIDWAQSVVMPGYPSSLWVVTGETAATKADLIRAYVRGFYKGAEWVNANIGDPDYMKLVATFTKTDEKLLAKMALNKQPMDIDPVGIERMAAMMRENGLLKTNLDIPSKIFT